jgi:cell division FtsZ-interacting protein ZapD
MATHPDAAAAVNAHAKSIDDLHAKLAAVPGIDQDKLNAAVAKLKSAFASFQDDTQTVPHM